MDNRRLLTMGIGMLVSTSLMAAWVCQMNCVMLHSPLSAKGIAGGQSYASLSWQTQVGLDARLEFFTLVA